MTHQSQIAPRHNKFHVGNGVDKKHYNNESLVYLGNYLSAEHKYFQLPVKEIMNEIDPLLANISLSILMA